MPLFLVTPSSVPMEEVDKFRQEFIDNNLKIHGCNGLRRATSAYDWYLHWLWAGDGAHLQFFSYSTELNQYVGCIRLTPAIPPYMVSALGFNVGYSIRPSLWNQGLGTLQLQEGLRVLKDMGLKECIVAATTGSASAHVIEKRGGTELFRKDSDTVYRILLTK